MKNDHEKSVRLLGLSIAMAAAGVATVWASGRNRRSSRMPLPTATRVDLNRYLGNWYEIARIPNRFERDCEGDTMAKYSLRKDGRIDVVNSCRRANGKMKSVRGVATVVDPVSQAKLKVTFFWPFSGDYWVLVLNSYYEYAVVGEPGREYLWILSRTPVLDKETYRGILSRIEELGYDPRRLVLTKQSEGPALGTIGEPAKRSQGAAVKGKEGPSLKDRS
jgi:apolipoprotein D and lipocalin family protein